MSTLPAHAFTWTHFVSDVTLGQILGVTLGVLGVVNAILTGAALRNLRQVKRTMRRFAATIGLLPEDHEHRSGQTLTAQLGNLTDQLEQMQLAARNQENDGNPSLRPDRTHLPQARRHRL